MRPPEGGDAPKLCAAFGGSGRESAIEKVLRAGSVNCGFKYIEQDELPDGLSADDLLKVG